MINGIIRHCTFSNLVIHQTNIGLNFHSSYSPGSPGTTIENIRFENITMDVKVPITMTLGAAEDTTKIRNIYFRGISGISRGTCPVGGWATNKLINISFVDIDFSVPKGTQPFDAMQLLHINGLRLENVRFFEFDKPADPSPFAIKLTEIDNGVYERCLPVPQDDPGGVLRVISGGRLLQRNNKSW